MCLDWGYFDEAFQGPYYINGIGFILYLSETHRFQIKGNVGRGTNNQGEFKDIYFLLKSSLDRGIDKLQVMGYLSMVINWMKGSLQVQNVSLLPLKKQLKAVYNQFLWISYNYIYKENNTISYQISKEGLQILELGGSLQEIKYGHIMILQHFSLNNL